MAAVAAALHILASSERPPSLLRHVQGQRQSIASVAVLLALLAPAQEWQTTRPMYAGVRIALQRMQRWRTWWTLPFTVIPCRECTLMVCTCIFTSLAHVCRDEDSDAGDAAVEDLVDDDSDDDADNDANRNIKRPQLAVGSRSWLTYTLTPSPGQASALSWTPRCVHACTRNGAGGQGGSCAAGCVL